MGSHQRYKKRVAWEKRSSFSLACLMLLGILGGVDSQQQPTIIQELDLGIQSSAFQRLAPLPKTGVIYNVTLDASGSRNSSGVVASIQAVRLRSGSLRRHGLVFNEFTIPVQCLVETTSKYVVLVYRDFSSYPAAMPDGFQLVGPVVGIKAYEGNDLSHPAPQELNVFSGPTAITVRVPVLARSSGKLSPLCASFDKEGTFRVANVSSPPNSCVLSQLVDSSLAVAASSLPPAPAPAPAPSPEQAQALAPDRGPASAPVASIVPPPTGRNARRKMSKAWKLGVGIGVGGIGLVMVAAVLVFAGVRTRRRARIAKMELCADNSESLQTALIGGSRAPAAGGTRTRPVLENDYVSP
ncbi:hypothetical protein SELMODRAFT_422745 [Selaginella moellendorffii]|uniref:Malectin-like domain-containing protein n=2 Tax=Selaginella moellendorffii TaxID=88036 RepID=D8SJE9_SELML|nr:hypothetical protein SELMODRAFT_422745 [Selaginella moellendorffii]